MELQETYIARLQEHFPDLRFSEVELVTNGWDNDVLFLDQKIVFRFPKRPTYSERFEAEVKLLAYLAPQLPIAVPTYIYLPPDYSFGGYKMLHGTPLTDTVFHSLSSDTVATIARQLGEFLSRLHATPLSVTTAVGFPATTTYCWDREHTTATLAEVREWVFPLLTPEEIAWTENQFTNYLSLTRDTPLCLIHSDLRSDHILYDTATERLSGIIDLADADMADPAFDFSELWLYGEDFLHQVLSHYQGTVDKDFLTRSKFPRLVHPVLDMLKLKTGEDVPVSFHDSKTTLQGKIASGISLSG